MTTPAFDIAIKKHHVLLAGLVEINLPGHDIRLLDGSGELAWGDKLFVGHDPIFGSLSSVGEIGDGTGDEAPGLSIIIRPTMDAIGDDLLNPAGQGSPVTIWLAVVDRATGTVIPDPEPLFVGELDRPVLNLDRGKAEIEFECVSAMERLFENEEGQRLSDAFHQSIWPGELGMSNVTGIVKDSYWGTEKPPTGATTISSSGGALAMLRQVNAR